MRIRIFPYKMGSHSSSRLAESLRNQGVRCLKVYPDRRYRPRNNDLIINWGNSRAPSWSPGISQFPLNPWHLVAQASNKLTTFQILQEAGVSIPEFTDNAPVALEWYNNNETVLARTQLSGHSGRGIEILRRPTQENPTGTFLAGAPLYVKYIKKAKEYRIHVFDGQVIDIQEKKKRRDAENINYQIRNVDNGWIFARHDVAVPDAVILSAISAVDALGLDFGAVDVIWNNHYNRAYVLEVNTAPGLEGTTIESYTNAILRRLNNV